MSLLNIDKITRHMGSPTFRDRAPLPLVALDGPEVRRGLPADTPCWMWRLGECSVILTHDGCEHGWHLSIAHPTRYPWWDEIAEARYRCAPPEITMAMLLPPMEQYVNFHPNCFQLHEIPDREAAATNGEAKP